MGTRETTEDSGGMKKKGGEERGGRIAKRENTLNKVLKAEKYNRYLEESKISGKTGV